MYTKSDTMKIQKPLPAYHLRMEPAIHKLIRKLARERGVSAGLLVATAVKKFAEAEK